MLCKVRLNKVVATRGCRSTLGMLLLAASISALLSGCLVDKKKDEVKIARATDTLHIYKANEYIEYDVIAVTYNNISGNTTQYGTMRVSWEATGNLTDPITPTITYPVLKETTTLTYDGNNQPDAIVARYISQVNTAPLVPGDPGIGSVILYAIDDQLDADYWLYDPATLGNPSSPVITPVIFESPLSVGNTLPTAFSVMQCASAQCSTEIYRFSDNVNIVGDTREISTPLGIFSNPFQLNFLGGVTPVGTPALAFLGDIRDACGTSADFVTHSGSMFVMPEIGIIRIENFPCESVSGDTVFYTITARSTNITS